MTEIKKDYLVKQYEEAGKHKVNHNYLKEQFSDYKEIFKEIEKLIKNCDYTLGESVLEFEENIEGLTGAKYCLGVGSGTDAIFLALKAIGIKEGDEVITTPYTFFATVGAIATAGAKPVFVDVKEDYNIDTSKIEDVITQKTKAVVPVHWSGYCCDMKKIISIAKKHNLYIIEDACHTINALYYGSPPGTLGDIGCFSMHPLKNLNIWGDGGYLITNNKELHDKIALLRNHGLKNRDEQILFGYNSRLDSLQAIVANHLLKRIDRITNARIANAKFFDEELRKIPQIKIPYRNPNIKHVFHIYVIRAERRGELIKFLRSKGIDAKIHYPIPMHLQEPSKALGYKEGDFPITEMICKEIISLPVHEFITSEQRNYVVEKIREFYNE